MNKTYILIGSAIVTSVAALGTAAYGAYKMTKAAATLNAKVDELSDGVDVDISDEVVSAAVERAVDREAKLAASRAVDKITREFDSEIRTAAKEAIGKEKDSIKDKAKEEIKRQIGHIDISEAKEEVISEAKEEVSERLGRELDGIKAEYNQHLSDVRDIYSSIAKSMKSAAI